jgi:hypothetical protein
MLVLPCEISRALTSRIWGTYGLQLCPEFRSLFTFGLAPKHDGIYERFRLMARNVAEGSNELVKVGIYSRPADEFDFGLRLGPVRHALDDFVVCLADERVEQVVQRILAHGLELVAMLMMTGLRAVGAMAFASRPGTRRTLRFALDEGGIACLGRRQSGGKAAARACAGGGAVGGESSRYRFLRHDGSIEGREDLGAKRARGGRVHVAGVARVLDAMHNRSVAVVGIRVRELALQGAVGARVGAVARDADPGARRDAAARHTGLSGRSLSSLRMWVRSSCATHRGQRCAASDVGIPKRSHGASKGGSLKHRGPGGGTHGGTAVARGRQRSTLTHGHAWTAGEMDMRVARRAQPVKERCVVCYGMGQMAATPAPGASRP